MADNSIFNLFIGALSLVTAISSTILCFRAFLPRMQMRLFIEIMDETKAMLLEADQKGLLQDESTRQYLATQIEKLEGLGTELHDEICEARTQFEEHIAALKGLSRDVMRLVGKARYLRSWVATHTAQEKRRRQAEGELAVDQDRPNISHQADRESIDALPDAMTGDLEGARTEEMPPAYPPINHDCQCAPCSTHRNTEARSETNTAPAYIPIWKRFWRLSFRPDTQMSTECRV